MESLLDILYLQEYHKIRKRKANFPFVQERGML